MYGHGVTGGGLASLPITGATGSLWLIVISVLVISLGLALTRFIPKRVR
jgi:LPXTG-motif cell wall-anchored protein